MIQANFTHKIGTLKLWAKQAVIGFITGLHKSPLHGFSVEFSEHRAYNQGESTKHIDWKLFARTNKLYTKKYEEETNLRCQFVLDVSSSMNFKDQATSKLEFSIGSIACLIELLKKQRDAYGLTLFSDQVHLHTDQKNSSTHQQFMLSTLEKLLNQNQAKQTALVDALHQTAEKLPRRSLVVIFSDMLSSNASEDELFSALQHLKHRKHEVIMFHVADHQKELHFEFEDRLYEFQDLETKQKIKLHPNEVKELYAKQMGNYIDELKTKCGQYLIDFEMIDIRQPIDEVLRAYLMKRNRVH